MTLHCACGMRPAMAKHSAIPPGPAERPTPPVGRWARQQVTPDQRNGGSVRLPAVHGSVRDSERSLSIGHPRILADLVDANGVLPDIQPGVLYKGDDLGKWLQQPGT